jgi:hypothetical protein
MKITIIITFLLFTTIILAADIDIERIYRYAGENAPELVDLLETAAPDTLPYYEFLLKNSSASDLAILTADYLKQNVHYALLSRTLKYAKSYDDQIFNHFVLPHRMSQEPLEEWRPEFYKELLPMIEDYEHIEEAAIIINIWCLEQMTYKPTHGRDQSAFTSIKRGFGRCEEMMIIYMCAARALGIPVRSCSAPYWNFTDSNHAWIEVWTPTGWKYLGEPASSLSKTWFTSTTQRATLITANAFGNYHHHNTIKQKDNVTTLCSIEFYTESYKCRITIIDENNEPVADALVMPMAVSFGGIWQMTSLITDENGSCSIPLGKGSTLLMAGKDSLAAWQMLTNLDGDDRDIVLTLTQNRQIDEEFLFLFPLPGSNPLDNEEPTFFDEKFDLMRENADLKRKTRLDSRKQTAEFARLYDAVYQKKPPDDEYFAERKSFLDKADELADNTPHFLQVLNKQDSAKNWIIMEMIKTWDIKDLCELPDSTAIADICDIFSANRYRFAASDSLFSAGCIARTWRSASPVQNAWQKKFYQYILPYFADEAETTFYNLNNWIELSTEIEEDFPWNYYSSPLTPPEILNLQIIPEFYRTKLLNSALKLAGVPVRWQGQLEYHNGLEWLAATSTATENTPESELKEFSLVITVDGENVLAEPYGNFLIASLENDGYLYPTWFDGENDSLAYKGKYRKTANEVIHIQVAIRNGNGDARVIIKPILDDDQQIAIDILTPREYLDISLDWKPDVLENIIDITGSQPFEGKKIIMIRSKDDSEPQNHTTRFLSEKIDKFAELNARLYIYSENRSIRDLQNDERLQTAYLLRGKPILSDIIAAENYPALFILDENNALIFSTTGYNMGIADLIIRKLK